MANPAPPRLLVLEDDASLREAIVVVLAASGYDVQPVSTGTGIEEVIESFHPDLAILDVRLPSGPDGFEVGRRIRASLGIPLVFVTAADALSDRLHGFDIGADDYLVKPFAMAELLARTKAVLRRAGRLSSPTWEVRDLVIDEANRVVSRHGERIDLTRIEFDLLCVLAREPGRVFSKGQLLTMVWGFADFSPNLVEVHVSALRRKLESTGPRLIHTERNQGYVIRP
ncbi:MAG TPA: response regulator transcription factor [Acidimicrobiales bacterium]|nr:response regulator transcription factor [Acidimicrobiales bacterium]